MAIATYAYLDDDGEFAGLYSLDFALLAPATAANTGSTLATPAQEAKGEGVEVDLNQGGLCPRYIRLKTTAGSRATVICGTRDGFDTARALAGVGIASGERFNARPKRSTGA